MSNRDENWWDAQCGEYVLGTLRGPERDVFEKILLVDGDAQERVNNWQQKLGALGNHMQIRQPPAHVLPSLMQRIRKHADKEFSQTHTNQPGSNPAVSHDLTGTWNEDIDSVLAADIASVSSEEGEETANDPIEQRGHELIGQAKSSNRFWKTLALLATAATLLLGTLLLKKINQSVSVWPISDSSNLSVVQDAEQQSLWLVTSDSDSAQATVVGLAPPPLRPDQSHHLWIINPDEAGITSVGPLPRKTGQSRTLQLPVPISKYATFAVSLEEATGSSQSVPTGPLLFQSAIQQLRD